MEAMKGLAVHRVTSIKLKLRGNLCSAETLTTSTSAPARVRARVRARLSLLPLHEFRIRNT